VHGERRKMARRGPKILLTAAVRGPYTLRMAIDCSAPGTRSRSRLLTGAALGALLGTSGAAYGQPAAPTPAAPTPAAPTPAAPAAPAAPAPDDSEPPDDAEDDKANCATAESYYPLLSYRFRGLEIQAPIMLAGRVEGVKTFPADKDGSPFQSGPAISPLARVGLRFRSVRPLGGKFAFLAEYEQDVPTGTWTRDQPLAGDALPNSRGITTQIRKGYGRFSVGPYLHVGGGFMTNHWGMGLIANDGAHGWEPGNARFTDPRFGDLVLRGFVGTGPLTNARLLATFAFDQVQSDDVLLSGDHAYQFIASVLLGHDRPSQIGYFFVHREQTHADGSYLRVNVADFAGKTSFGVGGGGTLTLEAEAAMVFGRTTLAPTVEVPRQDVLQLGAAARATLAFERVGAVLDLLYASGDGNAYDAKVTNFKTDPNFETGLLLFRYLHAAQTGRSVVTASNPELLAVPAPGIERLPSRGGITNAFVIFPRLWVRPFKGFEAYGGLLFAIAPDKNADALNSRIAGGSARNALDGRPGAYWGTEADLGLRYRLYLRGTLLEAGAEGAVLIPGSALDGAPDLGPVYGGRVMLSYRL
jgi:hypothetical protein